MHGCPTPEESLRGIDGKIDIDSWAKSQQDVDKIKADGYDWRVVKFEAEVQWPTLPDLAQRALNGSESIASGRSELEVMGAIADLAAQAAKSNSASEYKAFADDAATPTTQCHSFRHVLGEYTRLYAGGDGAPNVRKLHAFASRHAPTRNVGEEMWKAVTYTKFDVWTPRPLIRQAFIATALASCPEG